jgi:hypothetical protein
MYVMCTSYVILIRDSLVESKYKNAVSCFLVLTQNVQVRLTNTREIAMISDDVRFRYECNRNAFRRCVPVRVERKWNANGTQLEREWNAGGTQMERI